MGGGDSPVVVPRLKREDCERTKHDSAFSSWKVLIGLSDWEDFALGKEGATRYRVHNLPKSTSAGLYELGVAVSRSKSGREARRLDPSFIVVVYLGQADSVRTRLQQYGRSGAHLGRCSTGDRELDRKTSSPIKQLGLFEGILSKGHSIVFRWAPMNNKEDAQRTESWLLNEFDYAWNKGSNGSRRPNDVIQRLGEIDSRTFQISHLVRKLLHFHPKRVGIRIKGSQLPEAKEYTSQNGRENGYLFNGVFKFSRSQPRLVMNESGANEDSNTGFCGVAFDDGSICMNPPVQGRKRCEKHKGMKSAASLKLASPCEKKSACNGVLGDVTYYDLKLQVVCDDFPTSEIFSPICGVILQNGSPCKEPPVRGRKRCSEHKGMRIRATSSASSRTAVLYDMHNVVTSVNYNIAETHVLEKPEEFLTKQSASKMEHGAMCGVVYGDGTFCTRKPAQGKVRCEDHKGMRVNRRIH